MPRESKDSTTAPDTAETDTAARGARADRRRDAAHRILDTLGLVDRWAPLGRPVLVGSVALDVVVEPDLDLEIYSDTPSVAAGFAALAPCAELPGVRKLRFSNCLDLEDRGLYWRLDVEDLAGRPAGAEPETWQVDMWWLPSDHPGPRAADLVDPVRRALAADPAARDAVLAVKEGAGAAGVPVQGVWVYRAVLEAGVRTYGEFTAWRDGLGEDGLTFWRPAPPAA